MRHRYRIAAALSVALVASLGLGSIALAPAIAQDRPGAPDVPFVTANDVTVSEGEEVREISVEFGVSSSKDLIVVTDSPVDPTSQNPREELTRGIIPAEECPVPLVDRTIGDGPVIRNCDVPLRKPYSTDGKAYIYIYDSSAGDYYRDGGGDQIVEQVDVSFLSPDERSISATDVVVPDSQDRVSEVTVEATAVEGDFIFVTDSRVSTVDEAVDALRGFKQIGEPRVPRVDSEQPATVDSTASNEHTIQLREPYREDGEAYIYLVVLEDGPELYPPDNPLEERIDIIFRDDEEPTLSDVAVDAESDSGGDGETGASAETGEITTAFESDENPVNMEVVVEGPNDTTRLTRKDFSGDRFEGYESTVEPDEPGEYTITIEQARTAGNDDLLEETGEITRTVTIEGDNETAAGNRTDATNGTDADNETAAGNETDAGPDPSRERPAGASADLPDEVTVDGEDISTVPPVESADVERLETTTAEIDGEQRRVRLVDTTGDGTADLAVIDRDGDGDVDPTVGQFRTLYPNLEWESWEDVVA